MTHYSEEEYMEMQRHCSIPLNEQSFMDSTDAPESELAKKIRKHCKDNGLPCLIFPQTPAVKRFLPPGWPDGEIILMGVSPLYLELKKVKGGRKSQAQKDMATMFAYLGNPIYECKTYKRFLELLYSKGHQPTPPGMMRSMSEE